jgi:hypothetical protein
MVQLQDLQDFAQFVSTAGWAVGGFNRSDSTLARRVHDLEKRKAIYGGSNVAVTPKRRTDKYTGWGPQDS